MGAATPSTHPGDPGPWGQWEGDAVEGSRSVLDRITALPPHPRVTTVHELAHDDSGISPEVMKAHLDQVARLPSITTIPAAPLRGTVHWSATLRLWQFIPDPDASSPRGIDPNQMFQATLKIHI